MNAPTPGNRRKKLWWTLGIIALLVLLVLGLRHRAQSVTPPGGRFGAGGPISVGVAKVTTGDVPITINALGTVTPLATVTMHPQISGPLVKIAFTEGQMVKRGRTAGADRSASIPGRARSGRRPAQARSGIARQRQGSI